MAGDRKVDALRGRPTATVTAQNPMTCYVLTAAEFRPLLDASPSILRKITMSLARRLRNAEAGRPHESARHHC